MAANKLRLVSLKLFQKYKTRNAYKVVQKSFCTAKIENEESREVKKSDFAKFYDKQESLVDPVTPPEKPETFVSMLRKSKFIQMGDPIGKVVVGEVYHIVGNDLYIEFGWKFPAVCPAPEKTRHLYVVGTKVKLLIKELELSTKFLGGGEELTLCEADCILLGLLHRPNPIE